MSNMPMNEEISPGEQIREVEAVLSRRLEMVERENARLRKRNAIVTYGLAGVVGLALVTLALVISRDREGRIADALNARQFVLRSDADVPRGVWETVEDGTTRLIMRDMAGRDRVKVTLLPDGSPGITLSDDRGRPRVVVGTLEDGTTNLVLADQQGRTRAVLGHSVEDDVSLLLADAQGVTRAVLGVDPSGVPSFTVFEQGEPAPEAPSAAAPGDSLASPEGAVPPAGSR